MHRLSRWLPMVIVLAVAAITAVALLGDDEETPPVNVRADGQHFDSVDDLVAAADLVVEGVVATIDEGRSISDPTNPEAGVRTQLASLDVLAISPADAPADGLIVEQEAELLDGTPITVNGVSPLQVGDHVILVLMRGRSEEFPYTTPLNEQAVFYIEAQDAADAGTVRPADATGEIGAEFDSQPVIELRAALGL